MPDDEDGNPIPELLEEQDTAKEKQARRFTCMGIMHRCRHEGGRQVRAIAPQCNFGHFSKSPISAEFFLRGGGSDVISL